MKFPPSNPSRNAFTLLELLACIALIMIVLALLFPVTAGLRERGKTTQCVNLHRQYALALIAYAGEHGGWLPPYQDENKTSWPRLIASYLGVTGNLSPGYKVLRCPAASKAVSTTIGVNYTEQKGKAPFGIAFAPYPGSMRLSTVSRGTVLTADIENPSGHAWFLSPNQFPLTLDKDGDGVKETRPGNPPNNWFMFRHQGNAVVSLADGSGRVVTPREWGLNEGRLWGP